MELRTVGRFLSQILGWVVNSSAFGAASIVVILMAIMPVSVATYLWIELYDPDDAPDVAGYILVSTLLAIVVLPVVLTFWI